MKPQYWKLVAVVELVFATIVVALDLFIPTLVILAIALLSLVVRRASITTLGFKKPDNWKSFSVKIFLLALGWTIINLAVTLPILMRLTGQQRDISAFLTLQGNESQLLLFLLVSWTLAALGEELVYRGYLQRRIHDVVGKPFLGTFLSISLSSLLFGFAHTEQGAIGVTITIIDAIFFSLVKRHFNDNLWAAVLAHGFINTIGIVGFYFWGPIYSFW